MKKRTFSIIVWILVVSVVIYSIGRVYFFASYGYGLLNLFFAALLLFAETHSIVQSLGYAFGIIRLSKPGATYHRRVQLNKRDLPAVTVLVPARNEPLDILELTFISLVSLDYNNKKIVFLDGSDDKYSGPNKRLAEKYNITYFKPRETPRSKAEAINCYLPNIASKYMSVFDADQNPMPEFLLETVSLAEYSKKIAFVQTPQLYSNYKVSPIARGAALQQSIFYESVCESKGALDAMFCCGTNFLMRTDVFRQAGGFDETSVTEDFATSVKIHSLGYHSIYYNHVRVFGMAPETLPAYFKQQFRWSVGSIGVLRSLILNQLQRKLHLNTKQIWEYLLSATYYFVGWSFFILVICPALYLLFNVPTYFANPYIYLGSFVPFFILTLTTFYVTMKRRNYGAKDVFMGIIMGSLSFPILMQSSIAALIGKKISFQVTDKGKTGRMPIWRLWPWLSLMVLTFAAIIRGFFRLSENPYAIGINMLWCCYHFLLISQILFLNKKPNITKKAILKYV